MADLLVLDRTVLDWIADDFESSQTILANVEEELNQTIGESKILASLIRLSESGAACAFEFNELTQHFETISPERLSEVAEPWFKANDKRP